MKLRERREWMDALDQIKGATSSDSLVRLQGEARAPFRLTRLILVGSLDAGAIVGLLFIISRLVTALKGEPHRSCRTVMVIDGSYISSCCRIHPAIICILTRKMFLPLHYA